MNYTIEIATADFTTTKQAVEGGADRIELCAALTDGGTTASMGTIKKCRESFAVALFPIIRPRSGDFFYSDEEFEIMMADVLLCRQLLCDGVVIGLLSKDGSIDVERTAKLVAAAYPMEVTFHRAFDRCKEPFVALEQLVQMGCGRILTSGQQPVVTEGVGLVKQLVAAANERIVIMPGSGVRVDNIAQLAKETGAVEFHSSLRGKSSSQMAYVQPAFASSPESYSNPAIDVASVKELKKALETAR